MRLDHFYIILKLWFNYANVGTEYQVVGEKKPTWEMWSTLTMNAKDVSVLGSNTLFNIFILFDT